MVIGKFQWKLKNNTDINNDKYKIETIYNIMVYTKKSDKD